MHVNLQSKSGVTGSKRKMAIGHLTYTRDQCSIHPALATSKETHSRTWQSQVRLCIDVTMDGQIYNYRLQ